MQAGQASAQQPSWRGAAAWAAQRASVPADSARAPPWHDGEPLSASLLRQCSVSQRHGGLDRRALTYAGCKEGKSQFGAFIRPPYSIHSLLLLTLVNSTRITSRTALRAIPHTFRTQLSRVASATACQPWQAAQTAAGIRPSLQSFILTRAGLIDPSVEELLVEAYVRSSSSILDSAT